MTLSSLTIKNFAKGLLVLVLPCAVITALIYHYIVLQWLYVVRPGFWQIALFPIIVSIVVIGGSLCCLDTALAVIHKDHFDKWIRIKVKGVDEIDKEERIDKLDAALKKHRAIIESKFGTSDDRKEYFGSFLLFLISIVDTATAVTFISGLDGTVSHWNAHKGWLLHKRWPLPGADGFVVVGMGLMILIFMNIVPNKLGLRFPVECLRFLGWVLRYAEKYYVIEIGLWVFVRPIDSFLDAVGLKARD